MPPFSTYCSFKTSTSVLPQCILTSSFLLGLGRQTNVGSGAKKKNTRTPNAAIMRPGMMKERAQLVVTKAAAMSVPKMLPNEVWEFQTPMIKPEETHTEAWATYLMAKKQKLTEMNLINNDKKILTSLSFAKPVAHASNNARPACCLYQTAQNL